VENPLPYHLATPQRELGRAFLKGESV
jgi:hypothetical protein